MALAGSAFFFAKGFSGSEAFFFDAFVVSDVSSACTLLCRDAAIADFTRMPHLRGYSVYSQSCTDDRR